MTRKNKSAQDPAVDQFLDLVARLIARAHLRDGHADHGDGDVHRDGARHQHANSNSKEKNLDL